MSRNASQDVKDVAGLLATGSLNSAQVKDHLSLKTDRYAEAVVALAMAVAGDPLGDHSAEKDELAEAAVEEEAAASTEAPPSGNSLKLGGEDDGFDIGDDDEDKDDLEDEEEGKPVNLDRTRRTPPPDRLGRHEVVELPPVPDRTERRPTFWRRCKKPLIWVALIAGLGLLAANYFDAGPFAPDTTETPEAAEKKAAESEQAAFEAFRKKALDDVDKLEEAVAAFHNSVENLRAAGSSSGRSVVAAGKVPEFLAAENPQGLATAEDVSLKRAELAGLKPGSDDRVRSIRDWVQGATSAMQDRLAELNELKNLPVTTDTVDLPEGIAAHKAAAAQERLERMGEAQRAADADADEKAVAQAVHEGKVKWILAEADKREAGHPEVVTLLRKLDWIKNPFPQQVTDTGWRVGSEGKPLCWSDLSNYLGNAPAGETDVKAWQENRVNELFRAQYSRLDVPALTNADIQYWAARLYHWKNAAPEWPEALVRLKLMRP